jgi:hypothetical protein
MCDVMVPITLGRPSEGFRRCRNEGYVNKGGKNLCKRHYLLKKREDAQDNIALHGPDSQPGVAAGRAFWGPGI